jgi:Ser/Thr protein kinase RdoA (MazF antagonist)
VGLSVDAAAVAMGRLGACMAVVHATPPPPGIELRRFTRLDPPHLPRAAEVIATARPDAAASVDRLARGLLDVVPPMGRTGPPVLLHGDCHPGNLLSTTTRVALIDLDQAGMGPAAADIASLVARLRQGELTGEFGPGAADVLADAFLSGYAALRALPDPRVLAWHVASALLVERALRAVNRMNLRALDRLPELLNQAADVLYGTARSTASPNLGATR